MAVILHIPGPLKPYSGGENRLPLAAATVRDALAVIETTHPALYRAICDETGAVRRHVNLFVNAAHVRDLAGLETALADGDEIAVIPAVSGG